MSPFEHAEVFVLDDSGELELDLGNYERFLDIKLTGDNNITTRKMYQAIEDLTKALEFETNSADILHERGDIESMPFIEALLEPYLCSLIC
ncbi:uncharacterized protein LOC128197942 isoform X1 [Vigna angularis]|uniref:uncharacterized protein LOC128197942 isoform X1 n=1 Tax=Phaseolus angularis TaxID=3914 RepID=UPI0022B56F5D|nr:uncharacterized protein LOC128197942 isoform X1 [Vigna angularis]